MKTKQIFILALAALLSVSCSDNWLQTYPQGGTLTQDQLNNVDNALEGIARAVYPFLYAYGSGHDEFGERAIDMYTDLLSGDMAMPKATYGWFQVDAQGLTRAYRTSYVWFHYYRIIRQCNLAVNAVEAQGIPAIPEEGETADDAIAQLGFYYGQFLTLRGWAYASLMQFYAETADEVDYLTEKAIPVYTENYTSEGINTGNPRSTADEVYQQIEQDLTTAIEFLDAFDNGTTVTTKSKLEVNADVARAHLAYAYLNWGGHDAQALKVAKEVIDRGNHSILPNAEVLTNGFNNSNTSSWMWAEDVTIDNSTSLASFFGQVDIFSYSYASVGDTKGIDSKLYDEIVAKGWDIRADWFAPGSFQFPYTPLGKFFSPEGKVIAGDYNWLADQVFLRIESVYLTAAEAAYNQGNLDVAVSYLDAIMSERLAEGQATQYNTYKTSLTTDAAVREALIYNWRVEMWGEGYGLQTFRRLQKSKTLGTNQYRKGQTLEYPDANRRYTFSIPSAEYTYNQKLSTETLTQDPD